MWPEHTHGGPLTHVGLLCTDEKALIDLVAQAVADGLHDGDAVLVALPGSRLTGVAQAVPMAQRAAVSWVDTAATGRNPSYLLPGIMHAFAAQHHDGRIRMVGTPWCRDRSPLEYPACMQHEATVTAVFADQPLLV